MVKEEDVAFVCFTVRVVTDAGVGVGVAVGRGVGVAVGRGVGVTVGRGVGVGAVVGVGVGAAVGVGVSVGFTSSPVTTTFATAGPVQAPETPAVFSIPSK